MTDPLDKCFSEAKINGLTLRNRLIKAATFEGKSPGGVPSDSLIRFHERMGQGGIGMTTIAYCAAESDGRIHENMMYMHEGIRPELEGFVRTVKATGAKVAGQLGHCGAFTKNRKFSGKRPLGPSKGTNALGLPYGLARIAEMTKPQIRERVQVIGSAAGFMKSVGFDAIEIQTRSRSTSAMAMGSASSSARRPTSAKTSTAAPSKTGCGSRSKSWRKSARTSATTIRCSARSA
jgi:2,4-dienoyl-CoA reductase-like NADH-dependent reductase (Old Yellow Enzyme family)